MSKPNTLQKLPHWFFLLILPMMCFRCSQNASSQVTIASPKTDPTEMIQAEDGIKGSEEDPAVLYKSSDLGTNWTPFAKGIPKEATVSGIKQAGEKVYISTDYHGVFVISDGQDAWTSLQIDVPMGLDINCIEVEKDRILIGTFGHGVFLSTDGGSTWKRPAQNIVDVPIRAFAKSGARLYAGTDAGIYESVDLGNTWSPVFGKLQILGFTSLNGKLYAAAQNGALLCEGEPSNWKYIYEGDALHDIGNDGEYIYAMTIGQRLLKTKNDGVSWEAAQNGIAWPTNYYTNELQHIGTDVFSAQWIGVYHSSDHGNNWRILNGLPDSTAFSTLEVTDMGMMAGISIR